MPCCCFCFRFLFKLSAALVVLCVAILISRTRVEFLVHPESDSVSVKFLNATELVRFPTFNITEVYELFRRVRLYN